jgi:hypothetical protein
MRRQRLANRRVSEKASRSAAGDSIRRFFTLVTNEVTDWVGFCELLDCISANITLLDSSQAGERRAEGNA